jgi:competence ComEA-like helix-hairpin-helix protein
MLDLTRQEKIILLFLTLTFVTGLGISAYKKSSNQLELDNQAYELNSIREESDKFITQQKYININSFNIDELTRLSGIGETLATRIVEYHKIHGPFKSNEELIQVKGIGAKKFEAIKDFIVLE